MTLAILLLILSWPDFSDTYEVGCLPSDPITSPCVEVCFHCVVEKDGGSWRTTWLVPGAKSDGSSVLYGTGTIRWEGGHLIERGNPKPGVAPTAPMLWLFDTDRTPVQIAECGNGNWWIRKVRK